MMHLQGAAMLWSLGVLFTVFGFILLIFIDKFSYEKSTGDRVKHVLGYLGAAGLLLGFGFKFLEWPFATDMVYIAGFMLFIYFILNSTLTNKKLNA
jgi:hypothetical protein